MSQTRANKVVWNLKRFENLEPAWVDHMLLNFVFLLARDQASMTSFMKKIELYILLFESLEERLRQETCTHNTHDKQN